MSISFYEFQHECNAMPNHVSFVKLKDSSSSQFTIEQYERRVSLQSTTLYGFKYCPYCGEKLVSADE